MGFHRPITDDYADVWDECHCHCQHNHPVPIWPTHYTVDMVCNSWRLHQWGDAMPPISTEDRLCINRYTILVVLDLVFVGTSSKWSFSTCFVWSSLCNFIGLLSLNIIEHLHEGYCIVQTTTSFAFLSSSVGWSLRFGWKMNEVLVPFVCFWKSFYLYIYIMKFWGRAGVKKDSSGGAQEKGKREWPLSMGWEEEAQQGQEEGWECATICYPSFLSPPPLPATPSQKLTRSHLDCSCCFC